MENCVVYCIVSTDKKRTYVGATKKFSRRIRQHNGLICGGAKATRGRQWEPLFIVHGFKTWREALKFEYRLKHVKKYRRGEDPIERRHRCLALLLPQWPQLTVKSSAEQEAEGTE